jgi:hypothetical protein
MGRYELVLQGRAEVGQEYGNNRAGTSTVNDKKKAERAKSFGQNCLCRRINYL